MSKIVLHSPLILGGFPTKIEDSIEFVLTLERRGSHYSGRLVVQGLDSGNNLGF